jgi:Rrf2 family protein
LDVVMPPKRNVVQFSEAASLALHATAVMARKLDHRLPVAQLAEQLGASSHHLAKVMQRLAAAGLVESETGRRGGFHLTRPPEETTLLEIFEAMEEPLDDSGCMLSERVCKGRRDCLLGALVQSLNRHVRNYLAQSTLAELTEHLGVRRSRRSLPVGAGRRRPHPPANVPKYPSDE